MNTTQIPVNNPDSGEISYNTLQLVMIIVTLIINIVQIFSDAAMHIRKCESSCCGGMSRLSMSRADSVMRAQNERGCHELESPQAPPNQE